MWDLGNLLKKIAISNKKSDFFQTQDKATVIGLSSYKEDLEGSPRIVLI